MMHSRERRVPGRAALACLVPIALLSACAVESDAFASAKKAEPAGAVHPELWPKLTPVVKDDPQLSRRIEDILGRLTIEEKVAQIIQPDIASVTPEDVRRYKFGSVLTGGNSGVRGDDFAPAPEWLKLADEFYAASMDDRPGIPVMWGVDAVHGHNNIIGATLFPHNVGLGAMRNPALMRQIGQVTARELRVTGMEWTFAPTLAVVQDVRWGRAYESYSERPEIFDAYARAIIEGLQGEPNKPGFLRGEHVVATAKHFVGDGGTHEGRDQGDNLATEGDLRDIHAAGYAPALDRGVQAVMASFSSWQGIKIHGHKGLLTDVLKERMGFDGFIVGDWNAHGQVPGCSNTSCAAAINAGLDMFMAPDSWKELYENTVAQVNSGEIPAARLDDAVRRILRVKLRAGLFEAGKPSSRPGAGEWRVLGAPEHRAVARQAVRESLVLLKNTNKLLPLKPKARVLVAGDGADNLSKQNGGWTLTWQGSGLTRSQFPHAQSIYEGIREAVTAAGGSAQLSVDGKFSAKPDVAIVVFGEEPYAEFQGDIETLEYQPGDKRDLALLKRLHAAGVPVVAVFLSGRPLWVNPELNASDAFVVAWLPGAEGGGVADVLFTDAQGAVRHDFKGKLSFRWPRVANATAKDEPLFAYGFGLTYSQDGKLEALSEDVPPRLETGTSTRIFFAAGKPGRGWRLEAGAPGAKRTVLENAVGEAGAVKVAAVDHRAQEDARVIAWGGGAAAAVSIATTAPVDLQRESNGQLSLAFNYRVLSGNAQSVTLGFECGEKCGVQLPIGEQLKGGEWRQFKMMLRCFEQKGAGMKTVHSPLVLTSDQALQLGIAEVRLDTGLADAVRCE